MDARAGASDQGRAASGKGTTLVTEHGRAASGKKSKLIESGGLDLSGAKDLKFGADFSANKGTVTVTNTNNAAGAVEIASTFANTVKDLSSRIGSSGSGTASPGPTTADLSTNKTDGDTGAAKTEDVVWYKRPAVLALAVIALLILWLWKSK